jgi:dolichyl-diphosphooligosaccharide--protein glycosyltransferase
MKKNIQNESISRNTILLIVILLAGLIVRLFTYPQVIENDRIVFLETDSYYHMWRVFSYIDTFPKTFSFDGFINYPYGTIIGWPPLFDQSIAFISIIGGFGNPDTFLVELYGVFFPVFLGVFSIISVYYIAKQIFNERIAILSSLLLAVIPAHVQISFLGFTDHHIAEVLLLVAAYLFFIKSLNNGSLKSAIISGILIGISFLTWLGAPIFAGILLIYAIIQFILDKRSNSTSNYLVFSITISFFTAVFVILFFYIWVPWQHSIIAGTLSYFQPIYLVICATSILFLGLISNFEKKLKWYYYPIIILILFAFILLAINISAPATYQSITENIGYLLRDTPVLHQIVEAQSLFYSFDGKFLGWQFFNNPVWDAFTFSFYFAFIGFFYFIYTFRNSMDREKLLLLIWTLIVFVLALFQRRFTYMLAVNVAIISGFLIDQILKKADLISYGKNLKNFLPSMTYTFVILILVIPNISMSYELSQSPPKPSKDWYDSLVWLRDNTPKVQNETQ